MKRLNLSIDYKVVLPFALLFVVLLFIMPKAPKFNYDYKKGSVWKYETLISQFDFPVYKTEEQIQEEKAKSADSVIPYFKYSEEVVNKNLKAAEGLAIDNTALKTRLVSLMRKIYSQGVLSDESLKLGKKYSNLSKDILYIQKDKRAARHPFSEVYIQSDARAKLVSELSSEFPNTNLDAIFKSLGVYDLIVPNLIFDSSTTDLVQTQNVQEISPTQGFVPAGTLIVSSGEIVTAEIAQMLSSYKIEFESNVGYGGPAVYMWLGDIIVALALVFILFFAIFFSNRQILRQPNQLFYLLFIFFLASVLEIVIARVDVQLLYIVPLPLFALYLKAFFRPRLVVTVYMVSLLPLLVLTSASPALFVISLLSGMVYIYAFSVFNRSWLQFVAAMITFGASVIVYCGFRLTDYVVSDVPQTIFYLFINSILCVACYPVIYIFELVFGLVSNARLEELTDTNNTLLRRLEAEAPGTFQHSLQVMSMADAAARSIEANVLLVRAGALYHDIGKLLNPLCFKENEALLKEEDTPGYHENLAPQQSAQAIIKHVTDGIDLAAKYRIPFSLREFILTHHGTSRTTYFYNQFVNAGGNPDEVAPFTYPGKRPQTKEQIILMLCDSLEAASRTLTDNTPKAHSALVEKIVGSKMAEGQFEEADISIKELNIVKETLKSYLSQLYHERIVYPQRKRTRNLNN